MLGRAELFCGVFAFSDIHDRGPFGLRATAESMVIASGPSSWAGCRCHEQDMNYLTNFDGARADPPQHDKKNYALTGPDALTFAEMAAPVIEGNPPHYHVCRCAARTDAGGAGRPWFPGLAADGLLKSSRCTVVAKLPESNPACAKRWAALLVHSMSARVTTPRCSLADGQSRSDAGDCSNRV